MADKVISDLVKVINRLEIPQPDVEVELVQQSVPAAAPTPGDQRTRDAWALLTAPGKNPDRFRNAMQTLRTTSPKQGE